MNFGVFYEHQLRSPRAGPSALLAIPYGGAAFRTRTRRLRQFPTLSGPVLERRRVEAIIVSPSAFLELALTLPDTAIGSHQSGADLRVAGKIFASPADRPGGAAVLKLTPDQRDMLCGAEPSIFEPVRGRGAAQGWTRILVAGADQATAESALWMAWRNAAPQRLLLEHGQ